MPAPERSVEIHRRADFPHLINARLVATSVEVGTDRGVFASQLISQLNGDLVCVDPYEPYGEIPGTRQADLLQAVLAVQPWHGRVRFVMGKSPGVAKNLSSLPPWMRNHVGFVYIDASHEYEDVLADLLAWWFFLDTAQHAPCRILAGHDYDPSHPGVVRAVNEFSDTLGKHVHLVADDTEPSWYIYKDEPEFLFKFDPVANWVYDRVPNPNYHR